MSTISAILIDDELRALSSLQKLLELNCPDVEILQSVRRVDEARQYIDQLKPDLIFLDIDMPGKSGFQLLDEIDEIDFEIIFVTAYSEFTEQALHLSAVDYLLKPVDENLLVNAIERARKRIGPKKERQPVETFLYNIQTHGSPHKMKLCIPSIKGFQVVDIQNIMYIEASSNYSNFYFTNRPLICASKPLHEYATLLDDNHFVRVHKSYAVNLDHIQEYVKGEGGYVILTNGKEIEVSRRKKDILIQRMKGRFKF
jgi:two-component system LytT family response regulator